MQAFLLWVYIYDHQILYFAADNYVMGSSPRNAALVFLNSVPGLWRGLPGASIEVVCKGKLVVKFKVTDNQKLVDVTLAKSNCYFVSAS